MFAWSVCGVLGGCGTEALGTSGEGWIHVPRLLVQAVVSIAWPAAARRVTAMIANPRILDAFGFLAS